MFVRKPGDIRSGSMPSSYGSIREKMNNLEANSGRRGSMRGFSFGEKYFSKNENANAEGL